MSEAIAAEPGCERAPDSCVRARINARACALGMTNGALTLVSDAAGIAAGEAGVAGLYLHETRRAAARARLGGNAFRAHRDGAGFFRDDRFTRHHEAGGDHVPLDHFAD